MPDVVSGLQVVPWAICCSVQNSKHIVLMVQETFFGLFHRRDAILNFLEDALL